MKIQTVLWDNDGVLVDTETLFFEANRRLLAELGVELSIDGFVDINLRQGKSVLRHHGQKLGKSNDEIDELHRIRDGYYSETLEAGALVLPGVPEALEMLRPHFNLAVVTSSLPTHFYQIHSTTNLTHYFSEIFTRDRYTRAKPDPDPYLTAAKHLQVLPEHCVVIEDTVRGLHSAKAAGMSCIVIPNSLAPQAQYEGALALANDALDAAQIILGKANE